MRSCCPSTGQFCNERSLHFTEYEEHMRHLANQRINEVFFNGPDCIKCCLACYNCTEEMKQAYEQATNLRAQCNPLLMSIEQFNLNLQKQP